MTCRGWLAALLVAGTMPVASRAQDMRIRDITVEDRGVPVRLMGYGLVVGLDNSGDRGAGGKSGGMTVSSVVNLLRRFDVEVPAEVVRTSNVAAVLVTAEVSPYLRPGGRFEVSIASLGDARSLRGGVLWVTPLLTDVGGKPMGSAQGAILIPEARTSDRSARPAENVARIPTGGLLEADMPRPQFAATSRLILREPDVALASAIAAAVNKALGENSAKVEDPGAVALALKPDEAQDHAALLTRIRDLPVRSTRPSRLVIDARDGTIVAGGEITIGPATVSHGGFTLTIGAAPPDAPAQRDTRAPAAEGALRVDVGTPASSVAAALHAMHAPPPEIAAIFEALRTIGAISAEIVIR